MLFSFFHKFATFVFCLVNSSTRVMILQNNSSSTMEDRNRILRAALFVSNDQCGEDACFTTQISTMTNMSMQNIRTLLEPMAGYLGLESTRMLDQEIQLTAKGFDKATKLCKGILFNCFEVLFSRHENEKFLAWLKEQRIRDPRLLKPCTRNFDKPKSAVERTHEQKRLPENE